MAWESVADLLAGFLLKPVNVLNVALQVEDGMEAGAAGHNAKVSSSQHRVTLLITSNTLIHTLNVSHLPHAAEATLTPPYKDSAMTSERAVRVACCQASSGSCLQGRTPKSEELQWQ